LLIFHRGQRGWWITVIAVFPLTPDEAKKKHKENVFHERGRQGTKTKEKSGAESDEKKEVGSQGTVVKKT